MITAICVVLILAALGWVTWAGVKEHRRLERDRAVREALGDDPLGREIEKLERKGEGR